MKTISGRRGVRSLLLAGVATLAVLPLQVQAQSQSRSQFHGASGDVASSLPPVVVEAPRLDRPAITTVLPRSVPVGGAADGGDFLRSVPGVFGSRMGGHGIDPVIRGLQGNQLNIIVDGGYIFGGCPNRMDPPSSFAAPETFDLVTVSRGYQTVTEGPGGPGGSVSFEREAPVFAAGETVTGLVGGGWDANGDTRDGFADVSVGIDGAYARVIGNAKEADNYEDGGGNEIRSAFSHRSADLILGYQSETGAELSLSGGYSATDDALFEGARMDAPVDETHTFRGALTLPFDRGPVSELRASTYVSQVDHVMDNYSLRTRTAPMAMRVDAESDTYGGSLAADIPLDAAVLTVGMDVQRNAREAERFTGMTDSNVTRLNALMWPDTQINQFGLFVEGETGLAEDTRLVLGARYDRVDVELGRAGETVASTGRSPNDLYTMYYGTTGEDREENNLGGLARLEYDVTPSTTLHAGLSRSVRTADATERSMASVMASGSWIGNPDIAPEAHHQAELGVATGARDWSVGATAYVDRVSDFILRDSARGQDGILLSNGATVYRNVDAVLTGFTVDGAYRFLDGWSIAGDATYTYGENLDDSQPLAQIPPLEGRVTVAYEGDGWSVGTRFNGALKQTRVDDDSGTGSGRDVGKTPGWFTQDLFATIDMFEPVTVRFGVTNLFDREYANHLNRSNAFDSTEVQVNEPRRSAYLRVSARF